MGRVLNGENADVPTVVRGLPHTKNKCKKEGIQGPKRTQHHWLSQEDNKSNTMNGRRALLFQLFAHFGPMLNRSHLLG